MFGRQLVAVIVFVLSWKTVNPATQGRFLYCVSFLMRVAHTGEHSTPANQRPATAAASPI